MHNVLLDLITMQWSDSLKCLLLVFLKGCVLQPILFPNLYPMLPNHLWKSTFMLFLVTSFEGTKNTFFLSAWRNLRALLLQARRLLTVAEDYHYFLGCFSPVKNITEFEHLLLQDFTKASSPSTEQPLYKLTNIFKWLHDPVNSSLNIWSRELKTVCLYPCFCCLIINSSPSTLNQ